ncbi:RusA family crossover junction endodeoxyribonuclease [Agromyces atrinae]|uniref:RusA family crossover junction endodeoxyribonuclease n=1 Tax=Agromyces atrinae TaxID=592376 RepID=UPI001F593D75|nr:RusA family crossover junction endodeoxyribonuclease [Agromyces atrinae]MCI2959524.1 RusA family crossover junction endodeoxyribonuclease [Agromyces atrinae]
MASRFERLATPPHPETPCEGNRMSTYLDAPDGAVPSTHQTTATPEVSIFIPGTPIQQGSKSAFMLGNRARIVDQNHKKLKPWRAIVATHADLGVTFDQPVAVTLRFVMPRPQRPRWQVPAVKPDIDKLVRAVLDGLTDGGLIADDARVVKLTASEEYASDGNPVGVHVAVTP